MKILSHADSKKKKMHMDFKSGAVIGRFQLDTRAAKGLIIYLQAERYLLTSTGIPDLRRLNPFTAILAAPSH